MYKPRLIILIILLSASCAFSQSREEKKKVKKQLKEETYKTSTLIADSAKFTFTASFANPISGGNIPLIGIVYDLEVRGDSIEVFLPYFGNTRIATNPIPIDRGIKYRGLLTEYSVGKNPKKQNVIITFKSKSISQEVYRYTLYLGTGDGASLNVTSTHRDPISFIGDISVLE